MSFVMVLLMLGMFALQSLAVDPCTNCSTTALRTVTTTSTFAPVVTTTVTTSIATTISPDVSLFCISSQYPNFGFPGAVTATPCQIETVDNSTTMSSNSGSALAHLINTTATPFNVSIALPALSTSSAAASISFPWANSPPPSTSTDTDTLTVSGSPFTFPTSATTTTTPDFSYNSEVFSASQTTTTTHRSAAGTRLQPPRVFLWVAYLLPKLNAQSVTTTTDHITTPIATTTVDTTVHLSTKTEYDSTTYTTASAKPSTSEGATFVAVGIVMTAYILGLVMGYYIDI